jgi:5-(carboxyamino)imidazole ribonucleotide synthase
MDANKPLVGIVMGSRSDWETMQHAALRLEALGVAHEVRVVSAHRTPDVLFEYAASGIARPARDHRRRRRRGAPAGHAGRQDRGAGAGRAGAEQGAERHGLAAVDRADAGRDPGGDLRDRQCRRRECGAVRRVSQVMAHAALWPTPLALDLKRDRRREREYLTALALPQPAWSQAGIHADLPAACAHTGFPCRVKAASGGYDGRGQWRVKSAADIALIPPEAAPFTVEAEIDFRGEFSLLAVRGVDAGGSEDLRFWAPAINVHRDGILVRTEPDDGALPAEDVAAAEGCVRSLMRALDYRGVLAVEFFRTGSGILVNEFAPRVHNSGHWTIEGAVTSQFENHVRAVLGMPLGSTALHRRVITWNVLGRWPSREALLAVPGLHVHDYGKAERPGRKIGHVTLAMPTAEHVTLIESLLG